VPGVKEKFGLSTEIITPKNKEARIMKPERGPFTYLMSHINNYESGSAGEALREKNLIYFPVLHSLLIECKLSI